jgi:hypothetical protein
MTNTLTTKEIEEMKHNLNLLSAGSIVFVLVFGLLFHKYAVKHGHQGLSMFLVTVMPVLAIIYNIYYNTQTYKVTYNRKHELKEIDTEMKAESKFYEIIAFLLFGLGLIYAEFKKFKYLSMVLPYLLFALLFGTIFTSYIKQFVFDYNNLGRLLNIDVLIFCATSLAVGLLAAGLIVPIVYHSRKRGIAG